MTSAIEVKGVSKRYHLGPLGGLRFRDDVERVWRRIQGRPPPADRSEFWALRDVTFTVRSGETVGIVGRNGSGKSTLLKLLSEITEPTAGEIRLRGRVASLLEIGTGFHLDLTGRENIFLNGAMLGLRMAETRRRLDAILDFAGIGEFVDTPVKRYSSGMYMRLAFSVAAHLEPEILIVDEVLAVGDADYQKKCLDKMRDATQDGRTVLIVTHDMQILSSLCRRAIWMEHGRVRADGPVDDVVAAYRAG